MKERIRELYEQARLHAKTINADRNPQEWMDEYHKTFAELIVQECMKLNSQELSFSAIERLLPLYQEHFGVKE